MHDQSRRRDTILPSRLSWWFNNFITLLTFLTLVFNLGITYQRLNDQERRISLLEEANRQRMKFSSDSFISPAISSLGDNK